MLYVKKNKNHDLAKNHLIFFCGFLTATSKGLSHTWWSFTVQYTITELLLHYVVWCLFRIQFKSIDLVLLTTYIVTTSHKHLKSSYFYLYPEILCISSEQACSLLCQRKPPWIDMRKRNLGSSQPRREPVHVRVTRDLWFFMSVK